MACCSLISRVVSECNVREHSVPVGVVAVNRRASSLMLRETARPCHSSEDGMQSWDNGLCGTDAKRFGQVSIEKICTYLPLTSSRAAPCRRRMLRRKYYARKGTTSELRATSRRVGSHGQFAAVTYLLPSGNKKIIKEVYSHIFKWTGRNIQRANKASKQNLWLFPIFACYTVADVLSSVLQTATCQTNALEKKRACLSKILRCPAAGWP